MKSEPTPSSLRSIPSVDQILRELGITGMPRRVVLAVVRRELDRFRLEQSAAGTVDVAGSRASALSRIAAAIEALRRSRIQPVINGTGIIIHTNFGRAPLGAAVVRTLCDVAANYNNLEYDLAAGERGSRAGYLEHNLAVLCAAEAATVVNNCAAALILVLRHFAGAPPRTKVLISRGELVQIGGGFRIPEILHAAGCELREVGATNRTTADDFRRAIDARTAMILRVHQSNFYMGGFVEAPAIEELSSIARVAGVPLVVDIGSGATFATESLGGGEHEPTPYETLAAGADLVTFSGDKLLGGPQAGIIAGRREHVEALKAAPFFRALRCDKLILAALQTTVDLVLDGGGDAIEIQRMMHSSIDELVARAEHIVARIADLPLHAAVGKADAVVGGGSLPRTTLPSVTIDLRPQETSAARLQVALRENEPPIVGYLASNVLKLDFRTIFPHQDETIIGALRGVAVGHSTGPGQ